VKKLRFGSRFLDKRLRNIDHEIGRRRMVGCKNEGSHSGGCEKFHPLRYSAMCIQGDRTVQE
jgi:hypothetical protein